MQQCLLEKCARVAERQVVIVWLEDYEDYSRFPFKVHNDVMRQCDHCASYPDPSPSAGTPLGLPMKQLSRPVPEPSTLTFQDPERLRIYVIPLPSGLFRIRVDSKASYGPLYDGVLYYPAPCALPARQVDRASH